MNPDPHDIDWNAEVTTTPEQEYRVLLKSLRRAQGFKLLFVQCSPAEGARLIKQVREDLPQKRLEVLSLKEPITNLYELVVALPHKDQLDVLLVSGLEHSLYDYEKEHLWNEDGIYRFDAAAEKQRYETGVPRVLSHLNLSRERFQRDFPFSFVFLVPTYALKYLIRRAPDFFDWRSGVLEFVTDPQLVMQALKPILLEGDYQQYINWTSQDRAQRILEIQTWLEEPHQAPEFKVYLLFEQGNLFRASQKYAAALNSYDLAMAIDPDFHMALYGRSLALFGLERYEDVIVAVDRILAIQPGNYDARIIRGGALKNLGRYEESIACFDKAIAIKPDDYNVWHIRGSALLESEHYEAAVVSYNKALELNSNSSETWNIRSIALFALGQLKEAIASLDKAIELDKNTDRELRDTLLLVIDQHQKTIASYDHAVAIKPDDHEAWYNRGNALFDLGRDKDAIASYDHAVAIQPDLHQAWYNRSLVLKHLGREEKATESYNKAVALNPDYDKDQNS